MRSRCRRPIGGDTCTGSGRRRQQTGRDGRLDGSRLPDELVDSTRNHRRHSGTLQHLRVHRDDDDNVDDVTTQSNANASKHYLLIGMPGRTQSTLSSIIVSAMLMMTIDDACFRCMLSKNYNNETNANDVYFLSGWWPVRVINNELH